LFRRPVTLGHRNEVVLVVEERDPIVEKNALDIGFASAQNLV
jgi:hypothetical protein